MSMAATNETVVEPRHPEAWSDPIRRWQTDMRRRGIAASSIYTRTRIVASLARAFPLDPWAITAGDVNEWLDLSSNRAMATRRVYLSGVSGFYSWAIRDGFHDQDPTAKIPRPRIRRGLPRPIGTDELEYAIRVAPPVIKAWLLLAARQGLRCQEIAGIERSDITDQETPPMLLVRHAKGGRERLLPLHPEVLSQLRRVGLPMTGLLFPSEYHTTTVKPYSPMSVSRKINQYLHRMGISSTAHQLRHRFATDVFAASRDLRMTQELLGHQSPETTAVYAAWSPAEAVDVVRQLGVKPRATRAVTIDDLRERAAQLEEEIGRGDVPVSGIDPEYLARHAAAVAEIVELAAADVELLSGAQHEPIEVGHILGRTILRTALSEAEKAAQDS